MIDKRRMTNKASMICLKINIHIQALIVLQTQKFYQGKGTKVYAVYEHYSLYKEFPEDKRKSRSPSKKLSENYTDFLEEELESNTNLKNDAMVKLIKDKFGIEVSESTIRRALQEHEYRYIGPKICQKKYLERAAKRLDWFRRHLNKFWHNIFFHLWNYSLCW